MSVLAVEGLRVRLPTPSGDVTVVDGVDYDVQPGEVFGIAGESGSGKTVSMLALLGLLPERSTVEGTALFAGQELIGMRQEIARGGIIVQPLVGDYQSWTVDTDDSTTTLSASVKSPQTVM